VENFKKRLQALETKVVSEGILLTDSQISAPGITVFAISADSIEATP
jgi:hypothetical protein